MGHSSSSKEESIQTSEIVQSLSLVTQGKQNVRVKRHVPVKHWRMKKAFQENVFREWGLENFREWTWINTPKKGAECKETIVTVTYSLTDLK